MNGGFGDAPTVIIRKKVVVRHAGHSGVWKVAFADFATAMMALFMVLWLTAADQQTRQAVAGYFNDPKGFTERYGNGRESDGAGLVLDRNGLQRLAEEIEVAMKQAPALDESLRDHIAISVGPEGLRIELLEDERGLFFQSGRPSPTAQGRETIRLISNQLAKLPNSVIIEGHTDSRPFRGRPSYSNWELSADRANSARRILVESGFPEERITEVRGFAAMQPRNPENPEEASNRRISLIVNYDE